MKNDNAPADLGFGISQVDTVKYYERIDGSRRQLVVAGWLLYHERQEERFRIRVLAEKIASFSVNTREELVRRQDVADMYDAVNPWLGFRVFLETEGDFRELGPEIAISLSRPTGRDEAIVFSIGTDELEEYREPNVHYQIDQFALNGNTIRLAGWGYLSDLYEEYRPLKVWAEDLGGAFLTEASTMIRPDIVALFKEPADKDRKWGFFLLLALDEVAEAKVFFGEKDCHEELWYRLDELKRAKRERRRRYKSLLESKLHADPMQKADDAWYRDNLTPEAFRAVKKRRLASKDVDYDVWMRYHRVTEKELAKQRKTVFAENPLISIAVPAYRTPEKFLREMIDSVLAQTYENWELCIADGSLDQSIEPILREYTNKDLRIHYRTLDKNYGISGNTNQAILLGKGDYLALLDHDDVLTPDALYEMVKCINETGADCLYSDEDKGDFELEDFFEPHFKPDFNPDMLMSCNYICHLFMAKKEIVREAGPFRPEFDGSQDYDFILRCVRSSKTVGHVRKVLYHWRSHLSSTAMNPENKMYCYTAGRAAILDDLQTRGYEGAVVRNYTRLGYYEPILPLTEKPTVTIVTHPESAGALELERKSGRLYGKAQILTYQQKNLSEGDYLLFLNGIWKGASEKWIERLLSNCIRPEVGIVGALVYNELGRVSASGKIISEEGRVRDLFRGLLKEEPGYAAHALMQQDVSAVSDKCLMVKRELYDAYGGFKRGMRGAARLCRAVEKGGHLIVYTPFVQVKEKESPESEDIVIPELSEGKTDPNYHPAFDANGEIFTLSL